MRDDGAGVDWDAVAAKAAARGLTHDNPRELADALFTDGLSTRDESSLTSGRGTVMGALRASVHELGGVVEVTSTRGQGTVLTFRFPREKQPSPATGMEGWSWTRSVVDPNGAVEAAIVTQAEVARGEG